MPNLQSVTGDIYVESENYMTSFTTGGNVGCVTVGQTVHIHSNTALETIDLSGILYTGGYIEIDNNDALRTVVGAHLESIGDYSGDPDLHVEDNAVLISISFPLLHTVYQDIFIRRCPLLTTVLLPQLATIGLHDDGSIDLDMNGNPQLVSFVAPLLRAANIDDIDFDLSPNVPACQMVIPQICDTAAPTAAPTGSPTPPTHFPTSVPTASPTPPTLSPTESPTPYGWTAVQRLI